MLVLFRVVQGNERSDIQTKRRFDTVDGGYEGKLFWTSERDAARFVELLGRQGIGPSWLYEACIDVDPADRRLERVETDGRLAVFVSEYDLGWLNDSVTSDRARQTVMADLIHPQFEVPASVRLFATGDGGRRSPVRTGYRAAIWFGETTSQGRPAFHSVVLNSGDQMLAPGGERAEVLLRPLAPETWPPLKEGAPFDLFEGRRRIGQGVLESTLPADAQLPQLRDVLTNAFEHWIVDRAGVPVRSRFAAADAGFDFFVTFADENQHQTRLVVQIKAARVGTRDIRQLVSAMQSFDATLALIITLDDPSPDVLRAVYGAGIVDFGPGSSMPAVRWITARQIASADFEIFPPNSSMTAVERLVA